MTSSNVLCCVISMFLLFHSFDVEEWILYLCIFDWSSGRSVIKVKKRAQKQKRNRSVSQTKQ